MKQSYDAIVIGGGFYGVCIALYLRQVKQLSRVIIIEREAGLLQRASYNNQARVHNGYHYPRSLTTAYRSRVNMPLFLRDWPTAIYNNFSQLYAIARKNSKVSARQFRRFCAEIGAPLYEASPADKALFNPHLIEDVFRVEECAFDATKLQAWAQAQISANNIELRLNCLAHKCVRSANMLELSVTSAGQTDILNAPFVFNCTYAGLNQINSAQQDTRAGLKHELTEMAMLEPPAQLKDIGITIMDGPFFSLMPFPAGNAHSLSHVRYTPHQSWIDQSGNNPYAQLQAPYESRADLMLRDAARYVPAMAQSLYRGSLYEIKTTLQKNETDDGRPILFEEHNQLSGYFSILGGKIDNVYDILAKLDCYNFAPA